MVAMRFREGVAVLVVVFCSVVVRAAAQEGKRSYNVRNIYRNFTYRHAPSPCAIINWRVGNKGRRSLYVAACVYGVYTHAYVVYTHTRVLVFIQLRGLSLLHYCVKALLFSEMTLLFIQLHHQL